MTARRAPDDLAAIAAHLGIYTTSARLVLRLYDAGGRWVRAMDLMQEMSSESYASLRSTMRKIRLCMGDGLIEAQRGNTGRGYRLTPKGLAHVTCALYPPEMQDAIRP